MKRALAMACALAAAWAFAPPAHAAEPATAPPAGIEARAPAPRMFVGLRGGASTMARRPLICLDVSPFEFLSLDACGTGSGFLHRDSDPEIAHFRANVRLHRWATAIGQLEPLLGAGFAEIQVGEDDAGFQFGGVGPRGAETAGPEAAATLRTLYSVGGGFELVGSATAGMVYAPHAGALVLPQPVLQPFAMVTVGIGF